MDSNKLSNLNSCLYECRVMHHRLMPKSHRFTYGMFYFCVDLDELDAVAAKTSLISQNRLGLYSFYDADFIDQSPVALKSKVLEYVRSKAPGLVDRVSRVKLLTSLRILGYVFNPVSIYYCLDDAGMLVCAIAEVTNTFHEAKLYFLDGENMATSSNVLKARRQKLFYVSPFSRLDTFFDFTILDPAADLQLNINTVENDETLLVSSVQGKRVALGTRELLRLTLRYPLMSIRVIALIHWQAFRLFLKGLPFIQKEINPHLQTERTIR